MNANADPAAAARRYAALRRTLLGAIVLLLAQAGIGMAVNLYVTVPADHPGARPASYFRGSYDSIAWSVGHAAAMLAIHAALGLALVLVVIGVAVHAVRVRSRAIAAWSVAGGLVVIGADFNGASFLDFNHDVSSLIMALLAFTGIGCYAIALFIAAGPGARES